MSLMTTADLDPEPKATHKQIDAYLHAHRLQIMRRHMKGEKIRRIAERYEVSVVVMTRRIEKWTDDHDLVNEALVPVSWARPHRAAFLDAVATSPSWVYSGDDIGFWEQL
ncbi:hypothetical protein [Streptomyces sp. NPDC051183]|uniref:hypothetical protein n=1 Tax=Streptomyces sp. NPDC051183 TaxID=3155165 RepID=UPI00341B2698